MAIFRDLQISYTYTEHITSFLSVRDRASLIDVLNENQRMQQW
jgi:hypothetical protein